MTDPIFINKTLSSKELTELVKGFTIEIKIGYLAGKPIVLHLEKFRSLKRK